VNAGTRGAFSRPGRPAAGLPLLEDLGEVAGRSVLVRLDLNVPLTEGPGGGRVVADDFRIRAALPTLRYLIDGAATVTVVTHLGRPKGRPDERYSVAPVEARLAELGAAVEVRENLRFSPAEEENSDELVAELVAGQDLFVNDAFGVMHRAHASVVGPSRYLPSAAGRLGGRGVSRRCSRARLARTWACSAAPRSPTSSGS
jgi:phosphoglycerate kinase